jgi:hypothetical protein
MEERAVALQRESQVFCRHVVATVPLLFQLRAFLGEDLGKSLHGRRDQAVGLLYGRSRFIHKTSLDAVPIRSEVLQFVIGEKRGCPALL